MTPTDRHLLLQLQRRALQYFVDNQAPCGLMLDRQCNHAAPRTHGLCSTAATGMGLIALALASAPPYRLLTPGDAVLRIRSALEAALEHLPHDHGILPHFIDARTSRVRGDDHLSTIDSAWLFAGALWAAAFLRNRVLEALARRLYERVDWLYWTAPELPGSPPLLRHGQARDQRFLDCCWDRLNGETVFMYVLAAGAAPGHALPAAAWQALRPFYGRVAGLRFHSADLGLFVFEYGLDLLDLRTWQAPGSVDLAAEAALATEANHLCCRRAADRFDTYRHFWGLSAGDGPGDPPAGFAYRCYAPSGPVDGTAHVTATLAAVAHRPDLVLENLWQACRHRQGQALGRYGLSNLNTHADWVGPDMVAIDAGAAVLALDNYLVNDRVRGVFHGLPCVQQGLQAAGFTCRELAAARAA